MSIQGNSEIAKISKKQFPWKNDSGELDVFEAARYFSDLNELAGYNNGTTLAQKMMKDDRQQPWRGGGRMSLDMATIRDSLPPSSQTVQHFREKQQIKEKKFKQPSSPGGRLASFLNSLFNQSSSKKKKASSTSEMSLRDEDDQNPNVRRKRRSSISHFRVPSANTDSKTLYSSSNSGFRTPPPYAYTPTKAYKNVQVNTEKKKSQDSKFENEKNSDKYQNISHRFPEKIRTSCADQYLSEEKFFKKFNDDDDGADSDSSSDLFELPNFDLDYSSSGLPVYESTNVNTIKRGAPLSSGPR